MANFEIVNRHLMKEISLVANDTIQVILVQCTSKSHKKPKQNPKKPWLNKTVFKEIEQKGKR